MSFSKVTFELTSLLFNERGHIMDNEKPVAHWRIILAAILDVFTAFIVFGFLVAFLTGDITSNGFALNGWPALVLFALIIVYFWAGKKYFGGTIWKRILKVH